MTFSYNLHEAGWATATIEHEGRHRELLVSYLSDAVWKMLDAAVGLANGAGEVRFGFTDEPGEHECVVNRLDSDQVRVRVFWYQHWTPPGKDTGELVFECTCDASHFCHCIFSSCKRMLDEYGEDGYKERWGAHEFPTETFERLSRLLFLRDAQQRPEP